MSNTTPLRQPPRLTAAQRAAADRAAAQAKRYPAGNGYGASQHPAPPAAPKPFSLFTNPATAAATHPTPYVQGSDLNPQARNAGGVAGQQGIIDGYVNQIDGGGLVDDRYANTSIFDLMSGPGSAGSSGGGGSRGRGGGGGGGGGSAQAAADAQAAKDALNHLMWTGTDSYNQLLEQQLAAMRSGVAGQNTAIDGLDTAAQSGFNARNTQLGSLRDGANTRLSGILSDLNQGAADTRQNVAGSYAGTDQALQGLMAQYAQQSALRDQGANQTLNAFGVGPTAQSGGGVQDLLMAGRGANTLSGGAADAMYAGRGNVYNGLNADVRTQNDAQFDSLVNQLQAAQQTSSAQIASQRAALGLQAAQQEAQARQATAAAQQQLQLQIQTQMAGIR